MDEENLRELLIESCHSNKEAEKEIEKLTSNSEITELLSMISGDEDGGDAPMQASYFLQFLPHDELHKYKAQLIKHLHIKDNPNACWVALALSAIHSDEAYLHISEMLAREDFQGDWIYKKALENYDHAPNKNAARDATHP